MKDLIKKLQKGTITKREEYTLYNELASRYRPHKNENYLYDQQELKDEFILAAWKALYRANTEVGDPMMFAVRRGKGAMMDYYRKVGSQMLMFVCDDCGEVMTHDHRRKQCSKCKSSSLTSVERNHFEVNIDESISTSDSFVQTVELDDFCRRLINLVKESELSSEEKELVIGAIEHKEDLYEYVKSTKNQGFANTFIPKVQSVLAPAYSQFQN